MWFDQEAPGVSKGDKAEKEVWSWWENAQVSPPSPSSNHSIWKKAPNNGELYGLGQCSCVVRAGRVMGFVPNTFCISFLLRLSWFGVSDTFTFKKDSDAKGTCQTHGCSPWLHTCSGSFANAVLYLIESTHSRTIQRSWLSWLNCE